MTSDEERQRHGDLIADYAAAKNRLVALRSCLEKAANGYIETGKFILTAHPSAYENILTTAKGLIERNTLVEHITEASQVATRIEAISGQLKALGLDIDSSAFLDPITRMRGL
jgi:hypothetical protein